MTADELDVLLYQKFRLRRDDMLAALKTPGHPALGCRAFPG